MAVMLLGALNLKTHDLYFRDSNKWSGQLFSKYNSSHGGSSYHLSTSYETRNYASISGFSFKNFGDLRMGAIAFTAIMIGAWFTTM